MYSTEPSCVHAHSLSGQTPPATQLERHHSSLTPANLLAQLRAAAGGAAAAAAGTAAAAAALGRVSLTHHRERAPHLGDLVSVRVSVRVRVRVRVRVGLP